MNEQMRLATEVLGIWKQRVQPLQLKITKRITSNRPPLAYELQKCQVSQNLALLYQMYLKFHPGPHMKIPDFIEQLAGDLVNKLRENAPPPPSTMS